MVPLLHGRVARALLPAIVMLSWLGVAAHAETIGQVTDVATNAFADNAGVKRTLTNGAEIVALEIISTDTVGKAAFRFADDTRLSVGPSSILVLDRFVYDPEKTASAFVIKATKGAFRFATGRGDHAAYRIDTPNASIGVRGTEFDVVLTEKSVRVSVREGRVNVCPNGAAAGAGCADARKGQSVIAEPTRARTIPTKNLPPTRLSLLPLPVTVLPKAVAAAPSAVPAAARGASKTTLPAKAQTTSDRVNARRTAAAARRADSSQTQANVSNRRTGAATAATRRVKGQGARSTRPATTAEAKPAAGATAAAAKSPANGPKMTPASPARAGRTPLQPPKPK